jgi:AraC-like DNA-binding protein
VGFSGDYACHLMRQFFSAAHPVASLSAPDRVSELLYGLVSQAAEWPSGGTRARLRLALLELIAELHRSRREAASADRDELESARLDILTRATERIDWRALARRYGMGYATFRRRFKTMTGRSPLDYQIQVRLNRAVELLADRRLTAREVAERLGYAHVHFFSRQFKKRFGSAPHDFRVRRRTEVAGPASQ